MSLLLTSACLHVPPAPEPRPAAPLPPALQARLAYTPLDPQSVRSQPEGITVEQNWFLDLYTLFQTEDYRVWRLLYPGEDGEEAVAHFYLPEGEGRHPTALVFPILGGTMVPSELLAKSLVAHGFAVARLERRPLDLDAQEDPAVVRDRLASAVHDARRLLDWLIAHPRVDRERIVAAGISLGSLQAVLLAGSDTRVHGALLLLSGGGLAEILHDSTEKPVRRFRDRLMAQWQIEDRDAFLAEIRPYTEDVEPLRAAAALDPRRVYLASGRFDRVLPPARAEALWAALGQPRWRRLPSGHYQIMPFIFETASIGARHLLRALDDVPARK